MSFSDEVIVSSEVRQQGWVGVWRHAVLEGGLEEGQPMVDTGEG